LWLQWRNTTLSPTHISLFHHEILSVVMHMYTLEDAI